MLKTLLGLAGGYAAASLTYKGARAGGLGLEATLATSAGVGVLAFILLKNKV